MDWSESLQNAIDYIEEHITEKIDYEEVARRAYSSNFHFQRVFGIMCGFTLGEYIRRRKLTLAGNDLLSCKMKVIDGQLSGRIGRRHIPLTPCFKQSEGFCFTISCRQTLSPLH